MASGNDGYFILSNFTGGLGEQIGSPNESPVEIEKCYLGRLPYDIVIVNNCPIMNCLLNKQDRATGTEGEKHGIGW